LLRVDIVKILYVIHEEALMSDKEKLRARLAKGLAVVGVEISAKPHPLSEFAGMYKGDPLVKQWKKSMAAYRRKVDKDSDKP
jgi:hypothetical protein